MILKIIKLINDSNYNSGCSIYIFDRYKFNCKLIEIVIEYLQEEKLKGEK